MAGVSIKIGINDQAVQDSLVATERDHQKTQDKEHR